MSIQQLGAFPLLAPRNTLYKEAIAFIGFDFTGAAFKMQVRTDWNTSGAPLLDLGNAASSTATGLRVAYAGTDTINNHIAAGRMARIPDGMSGTDSVTVSVVTIRIPKATIFAMPYDEDVTADYVAVYDILIAPAGGDEERWLRGDFTVQAGSSL